MKFLDTEKVEGYFELHMRKMYTIEAIIQVSRIDNNAPEIKIVN